MSAISENELTAEVVAAIDRGETVDVVRDGEIVARLVPQQREGRYADLVAQGRITLPSGDATFASQPKFAVPGDVDPVQVLLDMRAEDDDR